MPETTRLTQLGSRGGRAARVIVAEFLLAKVVSYGRYVALQMVEVAVPGNFLADILQLIAELWPPPLTSTA